MAPMRAMLSRQHYFTHAAERQPRDTLPPLFCFHADALPRAFVFPDASATLMR